MGTWGARSCGRQPLRWSHRPGFRPLCNPLLLSADCNYLLDLTNRTQQKWWRSLPKLGYRKTTVSTLGVLFFLLFCLSTWKEAGCCVWATLCIGSCGKKLRGPASNSLWGMKASGLCQWCTKILPTAKWVSLEGVSPQWSIYTRLKAQSTVWLHLMRDFEQQTTS